MVKGVGLGIRVCRVWGGNWEMEKKWKLLSNLGGRCRIWGVGCFKREGGEVIRTIFVGKE